jgi:hypothetical protein
MSICNKTFFLSKNCIALLLLDMYREDKANLDYEAKITIYAYLLYNKAIHNNHYYYFITSRCGV